MNSNKPYRYWKNPNHKKLIIAILIIQILDLYRLVKEFIDISKPSIREVIFSPEHWDGYASTEYFGFSLKGLVIFNLVAVLVIGELAKEKSQGKTYESILILISALLWIIIGVVFSVFENYTLTVIWGIILIVFLVAGIYSYSQSRKL